MDETFRRVFEITLGRDLFPEEVALLEALSPQGVAKVNTDISRGADLLRTLAELQTAHRDMQQWRCQAAVQVPFNAEVHSLVHRMTRPLTADELVLLSRIPPLVLVRRVEEQLRQGEDLEDILEEMAYENLQQQLTFHAHKLSLSQPLAVAVSRLAPTVRSPSADPLGSSSVSVLASKVMVGMNPITVWFDDLPKRLGGMVPLPSPSELTPGSPNTEGEGEEGELFSRTAAPTSALPTRPERECASDL
eukprot:RCo046329